MAVKMKSEIVFVPLAGKAGEKVKGKYTRLRKTGIWLYPEEEDENQQENPKIDEEVPGIETEIKKKQIIGDAPEHSRRKEEGRVCHLCCCHVSGRAKNWNEHVLGKRHKRALFEKTAEKNDKRALFEKTAEKNDKRALFEKTAEKNNKRALFEKTAEKNGRDMGIVCSGTAYDMQSVVNKSRGSVSVTAFSPLRMIIITAILGAIVFAQKDHLGSLIGAVIIGFGLYSVMWGKSKEHESPELPAVDKK